MQTYNSHLIVCPLDVQMGCFSSLHIEHVEKQSNKTSNCVQASDKNGNKVWPATLSLKKAAAPEFVLELLFVLQIKIWHKIRDCLLKYNTVL